MLFKWLIQRMNTTLVLGDASDSGSNTWLGILDIAGFESFDVNSLEQLFINLSNEHLQLHFNNHVFKMELDEYKLEGLNIDLARMGYQDNSDCVALIDAK